MGSGQFLSSEMWIIPVIIMIIYFLFFRSRMMKRSFFGNSSSGSNETKSGETALDILKKRYARGEISRTELEQMQKDI